MTILQRRATMLAAAACGLLAAVPAAPALDAWMTEEAMRAAFVGKTLESIPRCRSHARTVLTGAVHHDYE